MEWLTDLGRVLARPAERRKEQLRLQRELIEYERLKVKALERISDAEVNRCGQ